MTINTNPAREEYTSSAAQTVFNYTFKIYVSTDLNVYVTPVGQVANDATDITTAYTVDPNTIGDEGGGFITFTSPLTSGDLVTIVSDIPTDRTVDYQVNGDFIPETVNNDIDRTVSLVKQAENLATRTVQFQESQQSATGITLPAPSAGDVLVWNSGGTGFDNDDGSGLAGIGAAVAATAADVVTTNADVVLTNADVVSTNADVVLTNADVVLTNADVVLTNADAASTAADLLAFNDKYYGALAADPATAPSGAASTAGDLYFNTVSEIMQEYTGTVWQDIGGAGAVWGTITGTLADQTDLQSALDLKATLASPALTGTPTAPTASTGTSTTQLATTAFVDDAVTVSGSGAKALLNYNGVTNTIIASLNVSSVTDNGTGDFDVNFTTNLDTALYVVAGKSKTADSTANSSSERLIQFAITKTVSGFNLIVSRNAAATLQDAVINDIMVFEA